MENQVNHAEITALPSDVHVGVVIIATCVGTSSVGTITKD
jgi:hypothetical protein